jgi:hypothetical protein
MSTFDADVAALAARQAGTFSRTQALRLGATSGQIRSRLHQRRWRRLRSGVYLLAGSPPHRDRDRWVAHLAVGEHSILGHEGAARMHAFTGFGRSPVTLTVDHPAHPRVPGITVHQICDIAPHHRARMRGLPVTTPARTVVDLAVVASPDVISTAVQDLVAGRRLRLNQIGRVLADVTRPGKPRLHVIAELLDALAGEPIPQSVLERGLIDLLVAAAVPVPALQQPFPGRHPTASVVDGIYEAEKVIVEADGRRWHARFEAMLTDRERDQAAARAGWLTLRFLWEQIMEAPTEVAAAITETLAMRRSQLS